MKKVSIVLLLLVIMVLSMTGCGNAPAKVTEEAPAEVSVSESKKLELKPIGTYNLSALGSGVIAYRFDSPNDHIVVYELAGTKYLVGDDTGRNGTSYANMLIPDSEFIALSDKYLLFMIRGEKVAVEIETKKDVEVGISVLREYSFDELSDEEKDDFIYPVSSKTVTR